MLGSTFDKKIEKVYIRKIKLWMDKYILNLEFDNKKFMCQQYLHESFELYFETSKKMKIPINLLNYRIEKIIVEKRTCLIAQSNVRGTKQKVAIKFIPIIHFQEDNKEALIMYSVQHPNIIKIIDSFKYPVKSPRFFTIVMPLAVSDLSYYIEQYGPLSEQMCWKVMKDSLNALKYLHENNIWHRDLKLENILVMEEGETGISTAIGDFGGSDIIKTDKYSGKVVGTLYYAAPELLEFNLGHLEFKNTAECMFLYFN